MRPPRTRERCGKALPPDAPEGNCPACLLQLAAGVDPAQTGVTLLRGILGRFTLDAPRLGSGTLI